MIDDTTVSIALIIRVEGHRVLAKHHAEEEFRACVDHIRSQNPWASEHRTPELTKIPVGYGTHAQSVVPERPG